MKSFEVGNFLLCVLNYVWLDYGKFFLEFFDNLKIVVMQIICCFS